MPGEILAALEEIASSPRPDVRAFLQDVFASPSRRRPEYTRAGEYILRMNSKVAASLKWINLALSTQVARGDLRYEKRMWPVATRIRDREIVEDLHHEILEGWERAIERKKWIALSHVMDKFKDRGISANAYLITRTAADWEKLRRHVLWDRYYETGELAVLRPPESPSAASAYVVTHKDL